MVSKKAIAIGVGIGIAGTVGYLVYKAYAKQQQTSPPTGCGPYVPNQKS
jgi:hypothetical protein